MQVPCIKIPFAFASSPLLFSLHMKLQVDVLKWNSKNKLAIYIYIYTCPASRQP